MCRRALIGLEPTPRAAGEARRFVASTCERWGIQRVEDEISLAVSELVTNAVLHANTHVEVAMCLSTERVSDRNGSVTGRAEVAVRDNDPRPPVLRPVRVNLLADIDSIVGREPTGNHRADTEQNDMAGASGSIMAGRGLLILDAVADEWGITKRADGKEVWFAVPVEWQPSAPCPCEEATGPTASGRRCRHVQGPWDAPG
jgi:hypothetical protein